MSCRAHSVSAPTQVVVEGMKTRQDGHYHGLGGTADDDRKRGKAGGAWSDDGEEKELAVEKSLSLACFSSPRKVVGWGRKR